jgi:SAM-dependent methyltransferase
MRPRRPHRYPVVAGIPDLRVTLDADITVARERADARVLAEMLARGDDLSAELAASAEDTSTSMHDWDELDRYWPDGRMVLDIGCGSRALFEETARRWPVCVGVDCNLRRLVLARHRLKQAGVKARLVCANIDALPFADGLFDRVIADSVLELAVMKERALREWNRMLSAEGRLWISTSNRWSVSRDPQLGIPALSWLPMQMVDLWAKWHGLNLPHRALVGTQRLSRLLQETGFSRVRLGKPAGEESSKPPTPRSGKTLRDLALVREIASRVKPMLIATAGARVPVRRRVAFDRYVARLAL